MNQGRSGIQPLPVGDGKGSALASLSEVRSQPVASRDIEGDTLLTRLSLVLRTDATLGQLLDAATKVGASGVAFSRPGSPFLDLEVPRQADTGQLQALAQLLQGQPGILLASGAQQFGQQALPSANGLTAPVEALDHLLATRFPGAWNVKRQADLGQKVRVVVADYYGGPHQVFDSQLEGSVRFSALDPAEILDHGFKVLSTLAARFDSLQSHAANPSPLNLDLRAVSLRGISRQQGLDELFTEFNQLSSTGPVIVNLSLGFNTGVDLESARTLGASVLRLKLEGHYLDGLHWASLVQQADQFEDRVLLVNSAGNDGLTPLGQAYPGIRSSLLNSPFTLATAMDRIERVAVDEVLWNPPDGPVGDLRLDASALDGLVAERQALLGGRPVTGKNLLRVGSTTRRERLQDLTISKFSNDGAQLFAVGEGCHVLQEEGANPAQSVVDGTSFSSPQVAGLAAYLWQLDDSLTSQPVSQTIGHLQANARSNGLVPAVLDAYGSVLALDARRGDSRMRRELVDVVGGEFRFNEQDLQQFETAYALQAPGGPAEPAAANYSRHDLNGDGFTGGSRSGRFDLDAGPLGPDGAPVYSRLQLDVEGTTVEFNEEALTDLDILKYFAYVTGPGGQPLFYDTSHPDAISERMRIFGTPGLFDVKVVLATAAHFTASCSEDIQEIKNNVPGGPLPFSLQALGTSLSVVQRSATVYTVEFSTSLSPGLMCEDGAHLSGATVETVLQVVALRSGILTVEQNFPSAPTRVTRSNLSRGRGLDVRVQGGAVADVGSPVAVSNFRVATLTFAPDP